MLMEVGDVDFVVEFDMYMLFSTDLVNQILGVFFSDPGTSAAITLFKRLYMAFIWFAILYLMADVMVWGHGDDGHKDPTSGAITHGKSIKEGCVKVQVDEVIEIYKDLPVHAVTKTDEVETVKEMYHSVVQWPIYALKLANKETTSKSTRMDSSHSSPQRDTATTSFYRSQIATNTPEPQCKPEPEPKFIDPEVEVSLSIRKKGPMYNKIVDPILGLFGDVFYIQTFSPQELYPDTVQFVVPYSELLQLRLNGWLDVSIIRWFAMYFYGLPNNFKCVFFDPDIIKDPDGQTNKADVIKHIKEIVLHHTKKNIFVHHI